MRVTQHDLLRAQPQREPDVERAVHAVQLAVVAEERRAQHVKVARDHVGHLVGQLLQLVKVVAVGVHAEVRGEQVDKVQLLVHRHRVEAAEQLLVREGGGGGGEQVGFVQLLAQHVQLVAQHYKPLAFTQFLAPKTIPV